MKNLSVGKRCFWLGKAFDIIGTYGPKSWVLLGEGAARGIVVPKTEVEPLAEEVFKIGDRVRSQYTFRGTVTGFEPETNRVVCVSDLIGSYDDRVGPGMGQRTRWAYKVDELERIRPRRFPQFVFELNKKYVVTDLHGRLVHVKALEDAVNPNRVVLYRVDNGKLFTYCPKEIDLDISGVFGFKSIRTVV